MKHNLQSTTKVIFKTQKRPLIQSLMLAGAMALPVTGLLTFATTAQAAETAQASTQQYNIPAGQLANALTAFAEASGVLLSVDASLLDGKTTQGLQGNYSVETGLARLLDGSDLDGVFLGKNVIVRKKVVHANSMTTLDNVTVTSATKTAKKIDGVIASVEVIDQAQIKKSGANTLRGVLQKQPSIGLQYGRFPHPSSLSKASLSIRGAGANGTLVLVDGKRLPSETEGPYEIDRIPVEMIERIEIVKGSMSTLYGSDAMGGVINIITKSADQPQGSINLQYGQNQQGDAQESNFSFSHMGKSDQWRYGFYGTLINNKPFTLDRPYSQVAKDPQTQQVEQVDGISGVSGTEAVTYRDQAEVKTLGARLGYDFSERTKLDFEFGFTDEQRVGDYIGSSQFPNGGDPVFVANTPVHSVDNNQRRSFALDLSHDFSDDVLFKTRAYTSQYEKRNVTTAKNFTAPENRKFSADVRIDGLEATANFYNWDDHIVTTGMEYRKETRDSSAINPNPQSSEFITKIVTYKSLFIQDEIEFGEGWSANLGARYDDISNADQKTTFKAGILKALTDNTRLRANYSQGYRAPDIAELYVVAPFFRDARRFGSDVVFGPKQTVYDLKPETSQTFEVAMAHSTENFRAEVVAFRNLIDDKIEIVAKNDGMPSKYYTSENLDSVEINGVEVSAVYQMSQPLRLGFDAVWLDPINRTNDKKLTYTPELSASLSLDYQMTNRMTVSAIGRYIGEQFEDVANTQSIDAYHLIDLSMSYDWESNTQLYAGINNLADKSVDLALGANVGRYFYAGIKHQF